MFKESNFFLILYIIWCCKWSQGSDSHTNYHSTILRNEYTTLTTATPVTSTIIKSKATQETTVSFQQVDQNGYVIYNTDYETHNEQGEKENDTDKIQTFLEIVDTQNRSQILHQNSTVDTVINILAQEMDSRPETIGPNTTESLAKITLMPKTGNTSTVEVNGNLLSEFLRMKQFGMVENDRVLDDFPINKSEDTVLNHNFSNEITTIENNISLDAVKFNLKSISDKKAYNKTENKILTYLPETSDIEKVEYKRDRYLLANSKNKYKNIKHNLHKLFNNIMKNKQQKYQTLSEALKRLSQISDLYNYNGWTSFYLNPYLYNLNSMHPLKMLASHKTRLTLSEEVLLKLLINKFKQYLMESDTSTDNVTEKALQTTEPVMKNNDFKRNEKYQTQIARNFMSSKSNTENTEQVLKEEMCSVIGICDNDINKKNFNEKETIETVRRLILHTLSYLESVKKHISTKNVSRFISASEKLKKIIDNELGINYKPPRNINLMKKNVNKSSNKNNKFPFSKSKKSAQKSNPKKFIPSKGVEYATIKDDNIINETSNPSVESTTLLKEPKIGKIKSHARSAATIVRDGGYIQNKINSTKVLTYNMSYPVLSVLPRNNETKNSQHAFNFNEQNKNFPTYQRLKMKIDYLNISHVDGNQKIFSIFNYLANLTIYHKKDIENNNTTNLVNLENNLLFNEYYIKGLELIKNLINISMENLSEFPTVLQGLEILENNLNTEEYNNHKREKGTFNFCSYFTNDTHSDRTNIEKETTVSKMDIVNYIIKNKLIQLAQNMCRKANDTRNIVFKKEKRMRRFVMDSLEDGHNLKQDKMHRSQCSDEVQDLFPVVEGIQGVQDNNEGVTEQTEDSFFGSMGVPSSAELTYNNYI